ncbi:MAG TPA: sulfotransferase [Candidatus Obscuribacterales bacterium]
MSGPNLFEPLIHIGYHKTGSSWFQRNIWINSELGFFQFEKQQNTHAYFIHPRPFDFDAEKARQHFQAVINENAKKGLKSVISSEQLTGNPNSGGYNQRLIADRLCAAFPNAQVFLAIREQSSMTLSAYKQYVRAGGAGSIEQYVNPPEAGRRSVPLFDLDNFAYHQLIAYYYQLFGRKNVLVLPYEMFARDPKEYLRRILQLVDMPIDEGKLDKLPFERPVNAGKSGAHVAIKRRLNFWFVADRVNPVAPFPIKGANKVIKQSCLGLEYLVPDGISKMLDKRRKKRVEEIVGDRFAGSNALTAELIGIDLRQYGYPVSARAVEKREPRQSELTVAAL